MAIMHRNPPPALPLGRTPPDPCPVEFTQAGHNVPAQYYCKSCGRSYCVYHCIPTAHGCPKPDIALQPTRFITGDAWGNLYDPAVWAYLQQHVEGRQGLAVIFRQHGFAVSMFMIVKRPSLETITMQYQYYCRALGDLHLFRSVPAPSLEALVDGMPDEHKASLYSAVSVQVQLDVTQAQQQTMTAPPHSALDGADPRTLAHYHIPDVHAQPGFVPAPPSQPIVVAQPVSMTPQERLQRLDERDPNRTRTLKLPAVEDES